MMNMPPNGPSSPTYVSPAPSRAKPKAKPALTKSEQRKLLAPPAKGKASRKK